MLNERLNNLSQKIRTHSNLIKQLKDSNGDLKGSLTVNKNLVEKKLNTFKS